MFNDRLRSTRMYRKFTQQEAADAVGISLRSYQRYESGAIEPPYMSLVALSDFLDVPADFLLGRDDFLKSLGVSVDVPVEGPPRRPRAHRSH